MSDRAFPQTIGQLTFAREVAGAKMRTAFYTCSCGREILRKLDSALGSKVRSSFSACAACRKELRRRRWHP